MLIITLAFFHFWLEARVFLNTEFFKLMNDRELITYKNKAKCNQRTKSAKASKTELGIAIINLIDKYQKVSQKKEKYFLLTYNLQKALTSKYFQLIGETKPTLKSNHKPLFLFNDKKRFGYSLSGGQIYYVEYTERSGKSKYFHIQDWRILGDKLSVERSFNLLSLCKSTKQ